jgi:hypothetical protein
MEADIPNTFAPGNNLSTMLAAKIGAVGINP